MVLTVGPQCKDSGIVLCPSKYDWLSTPPKGRTCDRAPVTSAFQTIRTGCFFMSVEKIFWQDAYLTELTARVTGVHDGRITLDRTIFYAFSGGQESDAGTIGGYEVAEARRLQQEIFYTLRGPHPLKPGDSVLIKIDWERRYALMRLHFAAEIILQLMVHNFSGSEKIGAHISPNKARLDFKWPGNVSQTFPCLLYTSPSPRDRTRSRMPSSA